MHNRGELPGGGIDYERHALRPKGDHTVGASDHSGSLLPPERDERSPYSASTSSLAIPAKPASGQHFSTQSKRPHQICHGAEVRFCGTHTAPSISRASRTIAITSAGRSSIMAEVKRNTHQPSRTKRFCRQRSVSKTSEPLWQSLPSSSTASLTPRQTTSRKNSEL